MQIKMVWIIIGIITLALVVQISSVIGIEYNQLKQNAKLIDSFKISQQHTNSLVVYFSRSGNTELMAYRIAEIKKCNIMNLVSPDYKIGLKGWVNAMMDALRTTAVITPQKVDLSAYDTIYIGSPIWLYSPAPPVFEFVSKNDFEGKKVILFNSMNSKFEQKYIDNFAALVKQNGGEFSEHLVINRGRMTQQMRTDEFLEAVKNQVTQ